MGLVGKTYYWERHRVGRNRSGKGVVLEKKENWKRKIIRKDGKLEEMVEMETT